MQPGEILKPVHFLLSHKAISSAPLRSEDNVDHVQLHRGGKSLIQQILMSTHYVLGIGDATILISKSPILRGLQSHGEVGRTQV